MDTKQILSWKGSINRKDFLIWGAVLFAIKYNLDRLTAVASNRTWYITDYFLHADNLSIRELSSPDRTFYMILLLQSLPFVWFGTILCVKRLRSSGVPPWLVIFFFIPFVNLLLFVLLSAIPEKEEKAIGKDRLLDKLMPESQYGSAIFSVGIVLLVALAITGLLMNYLHDYGWSLFVGIPFFLGFGSVLIYGHRRKLTYWQALCVALISILFFNLIIFILAFEGILCIVMAFPILLAVAFIGATIGFVIHNNQRIAAARMFVVPVIVIPLLGIIEHNNPLTAITTHVDTEIIIDASKQEVWDELVAFSHINEPAEWLFKTGIAYPIDAGISGTGAGAIRKCNFTTGPFIEPITIWDEPNLLAFGVLDQPPPLIEWSIYSDLRIAHLDGYFKSVKGQFKLEELSGGRTKLTGTTWYYHSIWPSTYWRLWSDHILHKIHFRVLSHIKSEAEKP